MPYIQQVAIELERGDSGTPSIDRASSANIDAPISPREHTVVKRSKRLRRAAAASEELRRRLSKRAKEARTQLAELALGN